MQALEELLKEEEEAAARGADGRDRLRDQVASRVAQLASFDPALVQAAMDAESLRFRSAAIAAASSALSGGGGDDDGGGGGDLGGDDGPARGRRTTAEREAAEQRRVAAAAAASGRHKRLAEKFERLVLVQGRAVFDRYGHVHMQLEQGQRLVAAPGEVAPSSCEGGMCGILSADPAAPRPCGARAVVYVGGHDGGCGKMLCAACDRSTHLYVRAPRHTLVKPVVGGAPVDGERSVLIQLRPDEFIAAGSEHAGARGDVALERGLPPGIEVVRE